MEADWEFEVGPEAPIIDARWSGFVDLRLDPQRVSELQEARLFPGLENALVELNAASSTVWTSKCDFWPSLDAEDFDADEMDGSPELATHAAGCYVDLLPRAEHAWSEAGFAELACRQWCARLSQADLQGCRADLIIRRAHLRPAILEFGITVYLTACGPGDSEALHILDKALAAFTYAACETSKLQ